MVEWVGVVCVCAMRIVIESRDEEYMTSVELFEVIPTCINFDDDFAVSSITVDSCTVLFSSQVIITYHSLQTTICKHLLHNKKTLLSL